MLRQGVGEAAPFIDGLLHLCHDPLEGRIAHLRDEGLKRADKGYARSQQDGQLPRGSGKLP